MDERFECCRYEPSLEDLLADEVMTPVLRSAGLEPQELREMMVDARRGIGGHGAGDVRNGRPSGDRFSASRSGSACRHHPRLPNQGAIALTRSAATRKMPTSMEPRGGQRPSSR